ncbi:M3 family oligoendopeptidase [Alicyclobacillus vulcanalis]|uniref:Oligoendopeptidase, pepF/M3 family n=1 Tax=Alicyclobacillus vulcanalis TaxID=252246 RepID=A0A1N7M4M7_9BACL|nr:M3 family oligoendopeptidase [Alicyclobacillus vulcanalis]SIS80993.1 oligoendopeptidase, pepF/M3 family [Alicyclobacillus vulcanalis]
MSEEQRWDLESLYAGGSRSASFHSFLDDLETNVTSFSMLLHNAPGAMPSPDMGLKAVLLTMQDLSKRLREASAFVSCLSAQDMYDTEAKALQARVHRVRSIFTSALAVLDERLSQAGDETVQSLLGDPELAPLSFAVQERIERAKRKLPAEQERLIARLSADGYLAWGDLYDTIVGRMTAEIELDGHPETVSMGQLANRMAQVSQRDRDRLFDVWERAWAKEADLCAEALNHLAGFRLQTYEARGWHAVLEEPLEMNRMSRETLEAMWDAVRRNQARLLPYFAAKARLLGVEQLSFVDVDAPVSAGTARRAVSFDEAREFIVEQFAAFSPEMADFAKSCFEKRWIEAEDRPGKRPGGFCTSFPVHGESRIFVTFSGTPGNVATLAHELGHAYHQHVMRDLPYLATSYAMNVAECASTFAEAIVSDAAIRAAANDGERLELLNDKLQRAAAMLMNIYARFLFETRFYDERKRGYVSVERLNELMVEAQREAYHDSLRRYHPHFWASKLHFYITGTPFYNFPYTFGFLFSTGIHAMASAEGTGFADKYVALLRDTGRMRVEDLAQKHIGADLTQPDFWQRAIDFALRDLDAFVELADRLS